jgi:exodeoxyribonuclease-5
MDADGLVRFQVSTNTATRTLFIVDEASMIPDGNQFSESGTFQQRNLLEDLIGHVYSGQECKLLFLGDPCQLPPVGSSISPALDKDLLKESYFLDVDHFELEDVVRQSLDSGILNEATRIRYKTLQYTGLATTPIFGHKNAKPDVISISGMDLAENLNDSYAKFGRENTVVITRSNKRANQFNQAIRQRILFQENELAAGDQLMVVRNNYFWLPEQSKAGFIANGDTIEVQSLRNFEEIYDFHFAEATIRLTDYPDENTLDVKLLLDTLQSESPSLPYPEYQKLFASVMEDYMHEPNRRKRLAAVRNNPYFNALQIKHSNALTCHKTQGGQWSVVYIDKGFLQDDNIDHEYLRWLYTAVTRATERLYLVNFEDSFFEV